MNHALRLLLLTGLLCTTALPAGADSYGYPFTNPYMATVLGTPQEYRAELPTPREVGARQEELLVFPNRKIPEVLWYGERLDYSVASQSGRAPLIFVIAGTGASHRSQHMLMLQRAFYKAGFHVVSLSSPTFPTFISAASRSSIPGFLQEDSRDLYWVMQLIWEKWRNKLEVSEFYLTGYSLGGTQSAFVAKLDDEQHKFNFRRVLMINPAVSLYNSVTILEGLLTSNIKNNDEFYEFFENVYRRFLETYKREDFIDFGDDFLYAAFRLKPISDQTLQKLIGLSFRLSSASMTFSSDLMTNSGYIKPKNLTLSRSDSLTDYSIVSTRIGFLDYFKDMFIPYHRNYQRPKLTTQEIINKSSIKRIESYLRTTPKIGVVTNADDIILSSDEVNYLRQVFGNRAKIYPYGGHCGNMEYRDNVAYMIQFFNGSQY